MKYDRMLKYYLFLSMDTFICGSCRRSFVDIQIFMQHKETGCTQSGHEAIHAHLDDVAGISGVSCDIISDSAASTATPSAFLSDASFTSHLPDIPINKQDDATHTYIILDERMSGAVPLDASVMEANETVVSVNKSQMVAQPARRGRRPKNFDQDKTDSLEAVAPALVKPENPDKDKDGNFCCPNCNRSFNKERHYRTHKCLASSLYVDISKRGLKLDSGDEGDEDDSAEFGDDQEEYKVPVDGAHSDGSEAVEGGSTKASRNSSKTIKDIQYHTNADTEFVRSDRSLLEIEDVPIFRTVEEKAEFEATLAVDLRCVDHMYKIHLLEQEISNTAGGGYGRGQCSSLSLYSCNVCEKVFKTLSHMRLHCLVHTELKPFRCNKCPYATNTKGNLYTHTRKHTGQLYQCKQCSFRSINKSHLLEHEATHEHKRHPCSICHKDYATAKSLVNHIRKYHGSTERGQRYMQSFLQGRLANGSTVIHQCHVCFRKFKKKVDRDRHLFIHDIRDVSTTYQCELCNYEASQKIYLERHYLKHRVLYCCCLCSAKFPSTIRLLDHLTQEHSDQQPSCCRGDVLFEQCINNSLYLPEPDDGHPADDSRFGSLPPEPCSTTFMEASSYASATQRTDAEMVQERAEISVEDHIGIGIIFPRSLSPAEPNSRLTSCSNRHETESGACMSANTTDTADSAAIFFYGLDGRVGSKGGVSTDVPTSVCVDNAANLAFVNDSFVDAVKNSKVVCPETSDCTSVVMTLSSTIQDAGEITSVANTLLPDTGCGIGTVVCDKVSSMGNVSQKSVSMVGIVNDVVSMESAGSHEMEDIVAVALEKEMPLLLMESQDIVAIMDEDVQKDADDVRIGGEVEESYLHKAGSLSTVAISHLVSLSEENSCKIITCGHDGKHPLPDVDLPSKICHPEQLMMEMPANAVKDCANVFDDEKCSVAVPTGRPLFHEQGGMDETDQLPGINGFGTATSFSGVTSQQGSNVTCDLQNFCVQAHDAVGETSASSVKLTDQVRMGVYVGAEMSGFNALPAPSPCGSSAGLALLGCVENDVGSKVCVSEEISDAGHAKEPSDGGGTGNDITFALGFYKMDLQIFQKMRDTFGADECEHCGRLFQSEQECQFHVKSHADDRLFACSKCSFCAETREGLSQHTDKEHRSGKFPCGECRFVASNQSKLWSHQMSHLGVGGLQCPHCSEKFDSIKRLHSHATLAHSDLPKEELDKLTGFRHRILGKIGRRSYKCPHCDRVFLRANSELQKHIWMHEGVKPFKCSLCAYACRSKNNLQAHMLRHSSQKPFACQECGRAYKSKTALRWHVRSHLAGNLFKCNKCSYVAQQSSHLKRHMETHDVLKRFMCQHCDYSANTAGYMKIHYARMHKGLQYSTEVQALQPGSNMTGQQVYKCLSCDYLFGNLSDLKRHLKIRHRVQGQDMANLDQLQISEVQVVHQEAIESTQLEDLSPDSTYTVGEQSCVSGELDGTEASAVGILQQIMSWQQNEVTVPMQQEFRIMSEDGQLLSVNPETIILQHEGVNNVLLGNGGVAGGEYVIQYIGQQQGEGSVDDTALQEIAMEVQTVDSASHGLFSAT